MRLYVIELKGQLKAVAEDEAGVLHDITQLAGGVFALSQTGLISFIRQSDVGLGQLKQHLRSAQGRGELPRSILDDARLMPPLLWPSKIVCVGQNYADHCAEQGIEPPTHPLIFTKFPQCIIGPDAPIQYPDIVEKLDYEVELAVVIGRPARKVSAADAMNYVFGYTVANDISARDLQKNEKQWSRAKGCDTFCPIGPCIALADSIKEPQNLALQSYVNDELRQDSCTDQMIFGIAKLIEWCSAAFTLNPGDLLLTGTPPGVGMWREPSGLLQRGDRVKVEIENIGSFENPVE
jgi:acylpyruvate hydrolase